MRTSFNYNGKTYSINVIDEGLKARAYVFDKKMVLVYSGTVNADQDVVFYVISKIVNNVI